MPARILIINGNPMASTERIVSLGGEPYGENYANALRLFEKDLHITVLNAGDGERLPNSVGLADFDGIAWTGSSLSAYQDEPAVRSQIELARDVWRSGVPCFGSCWGQQIMCQALGGEVRANPKGIEIGIARRIALNPAGAMHPMYAGKGPAFDAVAIHKDEVVSLPATATVLAGNGMSKVQAVFITGEGDFWGVQYHPEFDLHMIATLLQRDKKALVTQGLFAQEEDVADVAADFEALHEDPKRSDLAWRYGIDADVLDPKRRMAEFGNWLKRKVLPTA